ncbi:hypothetical protein N7476_006658 [Penicillium atrosanguineum]|uniref:F-box domain-containing protein n=1 Tax=Penicillium atrosanguineum TaxID=1132637 RepID=A0A9W9PXI1_9EURO|nr:hypothetical protein N7476_006658 [Penicillium atrosanguineum]
MAHYFSALYHAVFGNPDSILEIPDKCASMEMLPVELLTEICSYLKQPEWIALRLTSKALYSNTLESFANHNLKSICILLTSNSLRQLTDLAANDTLRTRVQELWVIPILFGGCYEMDYEEFVISPYGASSRVEYAWETGELEAHYKGYKATVADHLELLQSDTLSTILDACVARFESLSSIGLRWYPTNRLLHPDRDFPCLGLRELLDQLDCRSLCREPLSRFKNTTIAHRGTPVFCTLLNAVISSKRKLKKLHTCDVHHYGILSNNITLFPPPRFRAILPLTQGLEHLHLCICRPSDQDEPEFSDLLDILVTAAPTLKTLTFSQWADRTSLSPSYFSNLAESINFTQLTDLHLTYIEITQDTLKTFLRTTTPTLRKLSLSSINLTDHLVPPAARHSFSGFSRPTRKAKMAGLWHSIWAFIRDELILEYLSMKDLTCQRCHVEIYDNFSQIKSYSAVFDSQNTRVSLQEWVEGLTAIGTSCLHEAPGTICKLYLL